MYKYILLSCLLSLPQAFADLNVHEWGTFTSVQGSDGSLMEGLQHTEETLPAFVYGRDGIQNLSATGGGRDGPIGPIHCRVGCKRFEIAPKSGTLLAVNQKLETPVLYFYADQNQKVSVNVQFPEGILSEWYPNAKSFSPEIGNISKLANGKMSWDIEVLKDSPLMPPAVAPDSVWAPSRQVHSDTVKVGNEVEKFIFYRGLGKFSVPFQVRSADHELKIKNLSRDRIENAFVIQVGNGSGAIQAVGAIDAAQSITTAENLHPQAMKSYLMSVKAQLSGALVKSGLYPDEAAAMVNTWSHSYFITPGFRVLYIVPRAWTDRLLPIQITPTPKNLVRTLVGRVEIMTESEEGSIETAIQHSSDSKDQTLLNYLGRFAEPKLLRMNQIVRDSGTRVRIDRLLRSIE